MKRSLTVILVLTAAALGLAALVGGGGASAVAGVRSDAVSGAAAAGGQLPPIRHVFVIVLENEDAATTFPASGPGPAPYLSQTMRAEGAYLPNYYGIGHNSNDNYIAMVSGQAPNTQTSADCLLFDNFTDSGNSGAPYHQQSGTGCVYPSDIQNLATQLDGAGLSWKDYNQGMGDSPQREASACGHPAVGSLDNTQSETAADAYATRHNPFVYFHSIIDDTALCDTHVVNLDALGQDLQSAATTPNYVFISPDLCGDGHDATCKDKSRHGGYQGINDFLSTYVPMILNSPAFKQQNGLLVTTFDESETSDASSCCGEIAGPGEAKPGLSGPGGGRIGAVAISPCIQPGSVDRTPYNHYSLLGSVEDLFGLARLGYAQLPEEAHFGSDLYNRGCDSPPGLTLHRIALSGARIHPLARISFGADQPGSTYTLQVRHNGKGRWRSIEAAGSKTSYRLQLHSGITYDFRVRATDPLGLDSPWRTAHVKVPRRR